MGKRIYAMSHKGKRIEMDESEFEMYQKDMALGAGKGGQQIKKFGYSGADPQGVRVNQPTPTYGQANTQQGLDQQRQMLQEIISLSGALERIQGQVQVQGILTPEQVNSIIIPLKQQIMGLADKMVLQSDYKLQPSRWQAPVQPKEEPVTQDGEKPFAGEEIPEEEAADGEQEETQEGEEKKPVTFGQPQTEQKPAEQKQPFGQKPNEQRQATNQQADAQRPQGAEQTGEQKPVENTGLDDEYLRQARELDPKGYYDPQQLAETLRRLAEAKNDTEQYRNRPKPQAGPKRREGTLERDLENPSSTYQR